jgi:hypothetical protein
MTIKTTNEISTRWEIDMARKDRLTDPAEIQLAIEAAIQDFVGKGLVADSGQRTWSERTGRYEIVWEYTAAGKIFLNTEYKSN